MKKLLAFYMIISFSLLLCGCRRLVPPEIAERIDFQFSKECFASNEEVVVKAFIGLANGYEEDAVLNNRVHRVIATTDTESSFGEAKDPLLLKEINEFPIGIYNYEEIDGKTVYSFSQDFVIPRDFFDKESNAFHIGIIFGKILDNQYRFSGALYTQFHYHFESDMLFIGRDK